MLFRSLVHCLLIVVLVALNTPHFLLDAWSCLYVLLVHGLEARKMEEKKWKRGKRQEIAAF